MEEDVTIYRPATSDCVAIDLASHGFLSKTPMKPEVAIGFRTLELFHRIRLRKASLSVEAFTRVMCDYYEVGLSEFSTLFLQTYFHCQIPFRRYLRTVLAETYEVYVRILNTVQARVNSKLGWDTPNWRVTHACRACCYKVNLFLFVVYSISNVLQARRRASDAIQPSLGT